MSGHSRTRIALILVTLICIGAMIAFPLYRDTFDSARWQNELPCRTCPERQSMKHSLLKHHLSIGTHRSEIESKLGAPSLRYRHKGGIKVSYELGIVDTMDHEELIIEYDENESLQKAFLKLIPVSQ